MTQKNRAETAKVRKANLKIAEGVEAQEQESFEGVQAAKYKSAHHWFRSGPLKAKRTGPGKYESTPGWVEDIFDESEVLYSLLSDPSWHPTEGTKHKSPKVMKEYQKKVEEYIVEIMTKSGYDADSDIQAVFDRAPSQNQGARNVLNSPKFIRAVDPRGDGTYDKKLASRNLNELFNFHGVELFGLDEASLAQGEAIAHLYSIWKGLEDERARRRGVEMERIEEQRAWELTP